jgi:glycerol-1-phosphate dehydrogenase [NAD(P)+]
MKKLKDFQEFSNIVEIGSDFDLGQDFLQENLKQKKIFVSEEKIWKNCIKFFPENFLNNFDEILFLKNPKADDKNLEKIAKNLEKIQLIIALGSGTIGDLCKFSAAKKNIPYAIFASAASMNGYLSKNASITINLHKKTLPATLPKKVFCNLNILKNAPLELTKAGLGDVMCFYSCWFDWFLSSAILQSEFDKKPFEILEEKMQFLIKNYQKFSIKSDEFLQILVEILMLSGLGMTYAGSSNPASQGEHLIAHVLSMKYAEKSEKLLHGQVIAVATLTALQRQKCLLEVDVNEKISDLRKFANEILGSKKMLKDLEKKLINFFGKTVAVACLEEYLQKLELIKNAKNLSKNNLEKLKKIYFDEKELIKIFKHFRAGSASSSLGFSSKQYLESVKMAKFVRNRFTCLDFDF